ncbi:uncharacterized protein EI97DRAFT_463200 [Westerdykella ornata]|uniref:Uncharacterized protein n=1 Tax=Westerdykella ornata TaxID=318751 RepID=A0A6A6JWY0_WESOR|nr:uncharacterized protein EI97DRAFT_463200 [Westerdykella ornata]KAF2280745.1 hypothetical protein EI97DRAFT_463200 [Westerdykella ornata]
MGKRRRLSASPDNSHTKRSRTTSRAKSVFRGDRDPYFPRSESSLPAPSDWTFRVKVICADTAPDEEVFKEAVQGLIRICFPDTFLDDLGLNVIEKHMREFNATEKRIQKMREVYSTEMIHRGSWMLAQNLDSPEKVQTLLSSVIAATNRLFGKKTDREVLDDMIEAFRRLRDSISSDDTDHLAKGGGLSIPAADREASTVLETSEVVPAVADKAKNDENLEIKATTALSKKRHKSFKPWTWDIDPENITAQDVQKHFLSATDLFAFHALPIAQASVGQNATKGAVRKEMSRRWTSLSKQDRKQWKTCLERLLKGDLSMLELTRPDTNGEDTRATPFPQSTSGTLLNTDKEDQNQYHRDESGTARSHNDVERTRSASLIKVEKSPPVEIATPPKRSSADHKASTEPNTLTPILSKTPIVDLLWGKTPIKDNEHKIVTRVVLRDLDRRVPFDQCTFQIFGGSWTVLTKNRLASYFRSILQNQKTTVVQKRQKLEDKLILWVVMNISAFPELVSQPFLFTYMHPNETPVVDLLCGPDVNITHHRNDKIQILILNSLKERSVNMAYKVTGQDIHQYLNSLGKDTTLSSELRRVLLERYLRQLALAHMSVFPDLKNSPLVKKWESVSGQRWG